ncbi:hypothetical protein PVA38_11230 [Streptococcus pneumoniae D39]|nr:hypothetical protein PVA38_11230 [Streptococcus pneumoniae D39]
MYKRQLVNYELKKVFGEDFEKRRLDFEKGYFKNLLPYSIVNQTVAVSYTHLRAHETVLDLVCRLLLEKKKKKTHNNNIQHTKQLISPNTP